MFHFIDIQSHYLLEMTGKLVPIEIPAGESFVFEHRTNTKLKQYILPNKDNS